jgi:Zn-finger nucleic acid-binding protein
MLHMVDRTQHHIEFEACTRCDNVFLDAGELSDLTEFTLFERVKQALETAATNLKR